MRAVLSLFRAGMLTAASYRLGLVFSIGALAATAIPLYYVATAMQPLMANAIATEGRDFFAFVLVGMVVITVLPTTLQGLSAKLSAGIGTGTFETLVGTPASLPAVLAGMVSYDLAWSVLRALVLLAVGIGLGVRFVWSGFVPGLAVLAVILAAYFAVGLMAAAMMVAFRTSGPLVPAVLTGSAMLGGVYFPTHVIPSWIEQVSSVVPLTYGLRALRRVWLDGAPLTSVAGDMGILLGMTAILGVLGVGAMSWAMRDARRRGTLGQY